MEDLFQAIVFGIIQGLTEFLPISSTAHLEVVPVLLGWQDRGAAFTAVIQWGTWFAAFIYFRDDLLKITRAWLQDLRQRRFGTSHDAKLAWFIIVGTVPIVVIGLLFQKQIKTNLRSLYVVAATAMVMSLFLWAAEVWVRRRQVAGKPQKDLDDLDWFNALLVGFGQAFAVIPGASRSGVTITAGLFSGMNRATAARFSFLLSFPAVGGAGLHQLYQERAELLKSQSDVMALVVATVVSGIVGYATIAFLLNYLKRHTTYVFIAYRLLLGTALLALLWRGVLEP